MNIFEFYTDELASLGFSVEDDKLLMDGTVPAYFKYNGVKRRMVLPTSAMIKADMEDGDGLECHAFHPLCESVLYGESGTIRFLKKAIISRAWTLSMELIRVILDVAAEGKPIRLAGYKKWLADICEGIKDPKFDKGLQTSFTAIENYVNSSVDAKKRIQIFIATEMKVEGVKYIRAANYHHCFEEEGEDGTAMYFGAKLGRKQDKVILHRLLETVFNWIPSLTGSNDDRPYFGALSRAWANYVVNYNLIVKGLKDHSALRPLNDAWIGQLDHLAQYNNKVQTLPFNVGPRNEGEKDTSQQDFRLQPSPANEPKAAPSASTMDESEQDLADFFRKAGVGKNNNTSLFGAPDPATLTPLQQRNLEQSGRANVATESINNISLAAAMGGSSNTPSILGGGTSGSLFSTGNSGGSLLGGNSGGSLLGGSLLGGGNGGFSF